MHLSSMTNVQDRLDLVSTEEGGAPEPIVGGQTLWDGSRVLPSVPVFRHPDHVVLDVPHGVLILPLIHHLDIIQLGG